MCWAPLRPPSVPRPCWQGLSPFSPLGAPRLLRQQRRGAAPLPSPVDRRAARAALSAPFSLLIVAVGREGGPRVAVAVCQSVGRWLSAAARLRPLAAVARRGGRRRRLEVEATEVAVRPSWPRRRGAGIVGRMGKMLKRRSPSWCGECSRAPGRTEPCSLGRVGTPVVGGRNAGVQIGRRQQNARPLRCNHRRTSSTSTLCFTFVDGDGASPNECRVHCIKISPNLWRIVDHMKDGRPCKLQQRSHGMYSVRIACIYCLPA